MRVLALDYGLKRTGIAVSDPLGIIASPLETIASETLIPYLKKYLQKVPVHTIVVGMPLNLKGKETDGTQWVKKCIVQLKNNFPDIRIVEKDERFTSKMALHAMITGGTSKTYRQNKGNIDKISASIILQEYLDKNITHT